MDYYLAPFSGDNYLPGKAVSSPHASSVVCQHHILQQDLHHRGTKDTALNLKSRTRGFRGRLTLTEDMYWWNCE